MRVVMREGSIGVEDDFVDLPRIVHAGDPLWIPEEEEVVRAAFDASNPWFATGRAATFSISGRARLAVFRAAGCAVEGRPAAFFGYFESVDDARAAARLLAQAKEWARASGAAVLLGPIDFDTFGRYRLRTGVEPGGGMPFPGEPSGRAAHPAILEQAGFAPVRRYLSQISRGPLQAEEGKRAGADALLAEGWTLEPLDGATWVALLPELHRRVDEIFADAYAYVPVSFERFAATTGAVMARRLCPRASVLARSPEGEVAGFLLVFPHYGPLVVQGASRERVPPSALSYEEHAPRLAAAGMRTGIVKTVGIAPRHRRRGVMDAMVVSMLDRTRDTYDRWIGALIREDNPSRNFGERHDRHERTYVLYGAALDGGIARGTTR